MKKVSQFLIIGATLALAASCVDKNYNGKINTDINVGAGSTVEIKVEESAGVSDIIPGSDFSSAVTDSEGNYSFTDSKIDDQSSSASVGKSEIAALEKIVFDTPIRVDFADAPSFVKTSGIKFDKSSIKFKISNPSDYPVKIKLVATSYDSSDNPIATEDIAIDATIPAHVADLPVEISGPKVEKLFFPVPKHVILDDIEFVIQPVSPVAAPAAVAPAAADELVFSLKAGYVIPFQIPAGGSFSVDLTLAELDFNLDDVKKIDADEIELAGTATSTLPLTIGLALESPDAALTFGPAIKGGKAGSPATTDFKAKIVRKSKEIDASKVKITLTFTNEFGEAVTINNSQTLDIKIDKGTLPKGLNL